MLAVMPIKSGLRSYGGLLMCGKMEIKDGVGNVTDEGMLFKLPE